MQSSDHDDNTESSSSTTNLAAAHTQSPDTTAPVSPASASASPASAHVASPSNPSTLASPSAAAAIAPARRVQSLNLNKALKPAVKPPASGVLVLGRGRGKLVNKVSAPKPVNLPSLKKENKGFDPGVQIVPAGTAGWKTNEPSAAQSSPSGQAIAASPTLRPQQTAASPASSATSAPGQSAWVPQSQRARTAGGLGAKDDFPALNDAGQPNGAPVSAQSSSSPSPSAAAAALQRSYQQRSDESLPRSQSIASGRLSSAESGTSGQFRRGSSFSAHSVAAAWASDDEGEMDYSQPIVFADGTSMTREQIEAQRRDRSRELERRDDRIYSEQREPREAWTADSDMSQDDFMKQRAAQRRAERENEERRIAAEQEQRARARLADIERKIAEKRERSLPSSPSVHGASEFDDRERVFERRDRFDDRSNSEHERDFHAERLDREYGEHRHDEFEHRAHAPVQRLTIRHITDDASTTNYEPKQVLQRPKDIASSMSQLSLLGQSNADRDRDVLKKQKPISISLKLKNDENSDVQQPATHLHLLQSQSTRAASKAWKDLPAPTTGDQPQLSESPVSANVPRTLYEPPSNRSGNKNGPGSGQLKPEPVSLDAISSQSGVPLIAPRNLHTGTSAALGSAVSGSRVMGGRNGGWSDDNDQQRRGAPHQHFNSVTSSGIPMIAPGLPMPVLGIHASGGQQQPVGSKTSLLSGPNDSQLDRGRDETIIAPGMSPLNRDAGASLLTAPNTGARGVLGASAAPGPSNLDSRLGKSNESIGFHSGSARPMPIGPSSLHASSVPLDAPVDRQSSITRAIAPGPQVRAPGVLRDSNISPAPHVEPESDPQQQMVPIPPQIQLLMQAYNLPITSSFITVAQLNQLQALHASLQSRLGSAAGQPHGQPQQSGSAQAQQQPPVSVSPAPTTQPPSASPSPYGWPSAQQLPQAARPPAPEEPRHAEPASTEPAAAGVAGGIGAIPPSVLASLAPQIQQLQTLQTQLSSITPQQLQQLSPQQLAVLQQLHAQYRQLQQYIHAQVQQAQQQQQLLSLQQSQQPVSQPPSSPPVQQQQQQQQSQSAPQAQQQRSQPAPIGTRPSASQQPSPVTAATPASGQPAQPATSASPSPMSAVATTKAAALTASAAAAAVAAKPSNWAAAVSAGPAKPAAATTTTTPVPTPAKPASPVPPHAHEPVLTGEIIRITNPHIAKQQQQQQQQQQQAAESKEAMQRIGLPPRVDTASTVTTGTPKASINIITPITPLSMAGAPPSKPEAKDRRARGGGGERRGRGTRGGQKNRERQTKDGESDAEKKDDSATSPTGAAATDAKTEAVAEQPAASPSAASPSPSGRANQRGRGRRAPKSKQADGAESAATPAAGPAEGAASLPSPPSQSSPSGSHGSKPPRTRGAPRQYKAVAKKDDSAASSSAPVAATPTATQ